MLRETETVLGPTHPLRFQVRHREKHGVMRRVFHMSVAHSQILLESLFVGLLDFWGNSVCLCLRKGIKMDFTPKLARYV